MCVAGRAIRTTTCRMMYWIRCTLRSIHHGREIKRSVSRVRYFLPISILNFTSKHRWCLFVYREGQKVKNNDVFFSVFGFFPFYRIFRGNINGCHSIILYYILLHKYTYIPSVVQTVQYLRCIILLKLLYILFSWFIRHLLLEFAY